jgi:hypothetical protein
MMPTRFPFHRFKLNLLARILTSYMQKAGQGTGTTSDIIVWPEGKPNHSELCRWRQERLFLYTRRHWYR